MDKKIIKNFIYNIIYQCLILLLPFITIPYISRVLTPEDIGINSVTFSVAQMFCTMGLFGIGVYGVTEIARVRDEKSKLTKRFIEIRHLQKIMCIISFLIYSIIYILLNKSNIRIIYLIQSINIIATYLDISWLFMGIEDFGKTVFRNAAVKFGSLIFIFIFVKESNDLPIYVLILALSTFIGNVSMWVYKQRIIINNYYIDKENIYKDFKNAVIILIPQICYQIYTSFDRSILGIVSELNQVGYYDQSQKIIRISVSIVTSLSVVMLPRVSNMMGNSTDIKNIEKILKKTLNITLFIAIGCTFGLYSITENFVPWFYGENFINVIKLIKISSVVCILTSVNTFLSNQCAIPLKNTKAYSNPIIIASIINVILNIVLGKSLGALGACISIVSTEIIVLIYRILNLKKQLNMKYLFSDAYKFLYCGFVMSIIMVIMSNSLNLKPSITTTIIEVSIGAGIYCLLSVLLIRKDKKIEKE